MTTYRSPFKLQEACTAKPPENGGPSSLQFADQSQPSSDCRANAALLLCMHWNRRRRCASCHAAHANKHSRRPSSSASRHGCARCTRVSPQASTISCSDHEQPQERRAARMRPRGGVCSLNVASLALCTCQHHVLLQTEVYMMVAGQFCVTCERRAGTKEPGGGSSHQSLHPGQVHD